MPQARPPRRRAKATAPRPPPRDSPLEALARHPILEGVGNDCVEAIAAAGALKRYQHCELLSREGEPALFYWFLCSGSVRVYYSSPRGLEVTVKLFGAPAAWAEMQVLHGYVHTENCVAVDRVTVLRLPRKDFERLLLRYPAFMLNVLRDTSARFLIAAQHERALAFLSVPERLAYLLLSYERLYGVPVEGGRMIRVRLSQEELAFGLGVARKSVARAFEDWLREGVLEKRGAHYVLRMREHLEAQVPASLLGLDWVAGRSLEATLRPAR